MYGKLTSDQRLFAQMEAILKDKAFSIVDRTKHLEELSKRGIKFPEVSRIHYLKNQIIFQRTYKVSGRQHDVYIYTGNDGLNFAPKNMCGVWVMVVNEKNKKVRVRQLWRTNFRSFIENFEFEIELVDFLINNPPKCKDGEEMELNRSKTRVCRWVRRNASGKIVEIKDIRENLPKEDYWWIKPAKKQIASKKSYELTRDNHGHKMQKRKRYTKKPKK